MGIFARRAAVNALLIVGTVFQADGPQEVRLSVAADTASVPGRPQKS
jgi:hypothetical protein